MFSVYIELATYTSHSDAAGHRLVHGAQRHRRHVDRRATTAIGESCSQFDTQFGQFGPLLGALVRVFRLQAFELGQFGFQRAAHSVLPLTLPPTASGMTRRTDLGSDVLSKSSPDA